MGSRTLSKLLPTAPSPATIRSIMADLEDLGLLCAPHISAGRLPTPLGMRLFVNGLLEIGGLPVEERDQIAAQCQAIGKNYEQMLGEAASVLSGLSQCAGVVVAPRLHRALKHLEFVHMGGNRALVVMVTADGLVENRLLTLPDGVSASTLVEAGNYLSSRLKGRTLDDVRAEVHNDLENSRHQLDQLTAQVVSAGLAIWTGDGDGHPALIVRGQSHLLDDVTALADLERVRQLLDALETSEQFLRLLDLTQEAQGVQIFIGAENDLFGMTGCSVVAAPCRDRHEQVIGAIAVIGPQRLNFARIIPMVDYTAQVVGRLIG